MVNSDSVSEAAWSNLMELVVGAHTQLCEELGSGYGHFFFERAIDTYGPVAGDGTL